MHVILWSSVQKEFFFGKKVESAMIVDAGNLTGSSLVLPSEPSKVVEPSFCFLRRDKVQAPFRMIYSVGNLCLIVQVSNSKK